jgi:hypothetical protein
MIEMTTRTIAHKSAHKLDTDHRIFWNALTALALGTLLGTLAVMPYDRLFGLPGAVCEVLQGLVVLVALSGLGIGRRAHLTVEAKDVLQGELAPTETAPERPKAALQGILGNLNRVFDVLKVQWSTGH